ncbi:MAG: esterase [Alphaproteobacteria bacterium PA3]|nr:MAG: esterase [Alphaproteobacteria bacterium PA3]
MDRRTLISATGGLMASALIPNTSNASEAMIVRYEAMPSRFTGARNVSVWLPADYGKSKRRYPVLYMHDGQNIFGASNAFGGQSWRVDLAMEARARAVAGSDAIVIGVWNTSTRRQDFSPAGVEAAMDDKLRARTAEEHGGPALSDGYLRFLVEELKPMIDRDYRTKPGKASTFIMGSSMGGLISLYGICEYPNVFGAAGCLSTHWTLLSAAESYSKPDLETPAMIQAFATYLKRKLPKPGQNKIWMDHGTINLDSFYQPYQVAMDQVFKAQGWQQGKDFESRVYEGADHNEASWRSRLHEPLAFLMG